MKLRGTRDEGIIVINAYRVCQSGTSNPDAFTQFQQERTGLRARGIKNPDPRKQILSDILNLIDESRLEGYRPILCWDANEDWVKRSHPNEGDQLTNFMRDAQLADPFYNKFGYAPRTYVRSNNRLDYILVDPALTYSIKRIGYMENSEANFSDHALAYIDFDEKMLFRGLVNRPTEIHSRQFMVEQTDKKLVFTTVARTYFLRHKIPTRVFKLVALFAELGPTSANIRKFRRLDEEIISLIKAAAGKTLKKKFGYMRSPELATAGQILCLYKCIQSCLIRRQPIPESCVKSATRLETDISFCDTISVKDMRRKVAEASKALRIAQKNAEQEREEWIERLANDRARAAGDLHWEQKMKDMKRTVEDRRINRKLSSVTKGNHRALDRIQVPVHDWFHSAQSNELYHYDHGVWEAYPCKTNGEDFFTHHTLKVLPDDAMPIEVSQTSQSITITARLPKIDRLWKDVTVQSDIEKLLLWRNKRHLQQADIEGRDSNLEVMKELRNTQGISALCDDILQGRDVHSFETTPEIVDWFWAVKRPDRAAALDPVTGVITKADYQEMFKMAKERTSSSGDIHYTLWKALAEQDDFAEFLCIMMSLPFMYGFVNNRWLREVDVMLEKKKDIRMIHTLRIIGLLEADFNTALKFLFAKKMMANAEELGLSDDQWGSRKNRSSIDAAMLKLLMFESARVKKSTIAGTFYDLVANYDRIRPAISNFIAQRCMVDKHVLRARALVLERMRRYIKTGLGVSKQSYGQEKGEPRIEGEVQGKGDVPCLWCIQSDTLLRAHERGAHGMCICNPTRTRRIKRCNTQFVDDCDGWSGADHDSLDPIDEAIHKMRSDAQRWNNMNNIVDQTVAFHKCNWQLLAWKALKNELVIDYASKHVLTLKDNKGGVAVINFLSADQPNKGLGYYLCPDGNQTVHFNELYKEIKSLCEKIAPAHLTVKEARQVLWQRLLPKLDYGLHTSYLTKRQSESIDKVINSTILPRITINRNTPRAVIHGPLKFGGMSMADTYTRQTQHHLKYMVKQLRWNKTVAGDILATLDNIQLASGFTTPILEAPDLPIDYIDQGWILDLRARLKEIGATLWVEDAWQPALQREHDVSLMEQFMRITTTKSQRRQLRAVLHWLRVVTLADLADPSGRTIPGHRLVGNWQATSPLEWPHQPKPTKKAFATFRRALRHTICLETSHYQRPDQDMLISTPLGAWLDVDRNVTAEYSRWGDELFCREPGDIVGSTGPVTLRFKKRPGDTGFFSYDGTTDTTPPRAIPISCQFVDSDKIWTKKPFLPPLSLAASNPDIGIVKHDTLDRTGTTLKGASDGSLYREEKAMAAAWLIANDDSQFMIASVVLHDVSSLSSYRAELEGTMRLLKHIEHLGMTPQEIIHWCDNESAVKANSLDRLHTPADMLSPDADLILALIAHKKRIQTAITCRHVFSHQDQVTKKSKKVKEHERKQKLKERRDRIREVEIVDGTHAPSPSISSESDSACSVDSSQELGADKHLT